MSYINVGALDANGMRFKTKKALKEACASAPESVGFDCTDFLGPYQGMTFTSDDPQPYKVKLSVCGPDPYSERKWYATAEQTATGWKIS
jgi:hypothetical protein